MKTNPSFKVFGLGLALLLSASTLSSTAFAKDVTLEQYPYADNLMATLSSQFVQATKTQPTALSVRPRNDRANVKYLEGRDVQALGLYAQKKPAHLVIFIGGVGATAETRLSQGMAEQIYNAGSSVLLIPPCISWQFALGASTTGLPGYTADDVRDLAHVLSLALTLPQVRNLQVTGYDLVGYSQGALDSAYLAPEVERTMNIHFGNIVMINPPVDLNVGVANLDALAAAGDGYTQDQKDTLMGYMINVFQELSALPPTAKTLGSLAQYVKLNTRQLSWVIGNSFQSDIDDTLYASQQVIDRGLLAGSQADRDTREASAKTYTFRNYMDKAVYPVVHAAHPEMNEAQMIYNSGLQARGSTLASDSRYHVITTADDLIINAQGLQWLRSTLGARVTVFDHGGHLGEAWAPQFYGELLSDLR